MSITRLSGSRPRFISARNESPSISSETRYGRLAFDAHVIDRQDVGVIQRACGNRFLGEAPLPLGIEAGLEQDLDGDIALQPGIARAIHLSHAAGAELADDSFRGSETGRKRRHPSVATRPVTR